MEYHQQAINLPMDEQAEPPTPEIFRTANDEYDKYWWPLKVRRFLRWDLILLYFLLETAQSLPTTPISAFIARNTSAANDTYIEEVWYGMGMLRPVYCILSDQLPIFGRRRAPYLIFASSLCFMFTILLGWKFDSVEAVFLYGVGLYLMEACAEAIIDTCTVELGNRLADEAVCRAGLEHQLKANRLREQYRLGILDKEEYDEAMREHMINNNDPGEAEGDLPESTSTDSVDSLLSPLKIRQEESQVIADYVKSTIQSEAMIVKGLGSLFAVGISIALLHAYSGVTVIYISSSCFVPLAMVALFMDESRVQTKYAITVVTENGVAVKDSSFARGEIQDDFTPFQLLVKKLREYVNALKVAAGPIIFIFIYYMMPSYDDLFYYYIYLQETPTWQQGLIGDFYPYLASLGGYFFYYLFLTRVPIIPLFVITTIVATLISVNQYLIVLDNTELVHMSYLTYLSISQVLDSFLAGILELLPIVVAHKFSPRIIGMEGTLFSTFQLADRVGTLASASIVAGMEASYGITYLNLAPVWKVMLICMVLGLLPLLVLPFLLRESPWKSWIRLFKKYTKDDSTRYSTTLTLNDVDQNSTRYFTSITLNNEDENSTKELETSLIADGNF